MYYTQSGQEIGDAEMDMRRHSEQQAQLPMMRGASAEESRLMDEAVARAVALGRPFEEQEVFQSAWELGYELHPALDQNRFQLHREGCWEGTRYHPRLWVVSDEAAHVEDSLRTGDLSVQELEATIASRRLSVRALAQVDRESGELELGTENGIECYSAEEALELLELLYQERDTLYALVHQGER